MTPQEIIKQGLEASKYENDFRTWASQWIPECGVFEGEPGNETHIFSLADLAFRAREAAGKDWQWAIGEVWDRMPDTTYCQDDAETWMLLKGQPYHWITAGCCALEMQKRSK